MPCENYLLESTGMNNNLIDTHYIHMYSKIRQTFCLHAITQCIKKIVVNTKKKYLLLVAFLCIWRVFRERSFLFRKERFKLCQVRVCDEETRALRDGHHFTSPNPMSTKAILMTFHKNSHKFRSSQLWLTLHISYSSYDWISIENICHFEFIIYFFFLRTH